MIFEKCRASKLRIDFKLYVFYTLAFVLLIQSPSLILSSANRTSAVASLPILPPYSVGYTDLSFLTPLLPLVALSQPGNPAGTLWKTTGLSAQANM